MAPDKETFRSYLACYGADVKAWPQAVQEWGLRSASHPEYAALIEEEKQFEHLLREDVAGAMPVHTVARIIAHAMSRQREPWWAFLRRLLPVSPAMLTAMLVFGFILGYGAFVPESQEYEGFMQSYSDEEGATL